MRRILAAALALGACAAPSEAPALARAATLEGRFLHPEWAGGDAWIFLFPSHQAPPATSSTPLRAAAVPRDRLARAGHWVMPDVQPDQWALWGLLDTNGNFDPSVDVLAQPGWGDVSGQALEINVQPSRTQTFDYAVMQRVSREPPAFGVEGSPQEVRIDVRADVAATFTLASTPVAGLRAEDTSFSVGLVDANGDLVPDDANGDGTPDLDLQLLLLWKPRPGQAPEGTRVVVPLAFDPSTFLTQLGGDVRLRVETRRLQVWPVPQALSLAEGDGGVSMAGSPPAGEYELWAVSGTGQFWRVPNQLGQDSRSQATTFHVDRSGG